MLKVPMFFQFQIVKIGGVQEYKTILKTLMASWDEKKRCHTKKVSKNLRLVIWAAKISI